MIETATTSTIEWNKPFSEAATKELQRIFMERGLDQGAQNESEARGGTVQRSILPDASKTYYYAKQCEIYAHFGSFMGDDENPNHPDILISLSDEKNVLWGGSLEGEDVVFVDKDLLVKYGLLKGEARNASVWDARVSRSTQNSGRG